MPVKNFEELVDTVLSGDEASARIFGGYYINGFFNREEIQTIYSKINSAKAPNLGNALNLKGFMYQHAHFANFKKAIDCYQHAIESDNVLAITNLGFLYLEEDNFPEARRLFQSASDKNNIDAMGALSWMHRKGLGAEPDFKKAEELQDRRFAILKGMTESEQLYASAFEAEDNPAILGFLENAVNFGYIPAMIERACLHRDGVGGPVDYQAAIRLFQRAAGVVEDAILPGTDSDNKLKELVNVLSNFQITVDNLGKKANKDRKKYFNVFNEAYWLKHYISLYVIHFYVSPTPENFQILKANCNREIARAKIELRKHRDIWFQVPLFIRAVLGILATITVVPAIAVAVKYDYKTAFFSMPETRSLKSLNTFETNLENCQKEIPAMLTPV